MKNILLILTIMAPCVLCAQGAIRYQVNGRIGSGNDSSVLYLRYANKGKTVSDSVIIQKGLFTFSGTVSEPVKALLLMRKKRADTAPFDFINIYLEPGIIAVNSGDKLSGATVKAGVLNREFTVLSAMMQPYTEQMAQLYKKYSVLPIAERKDSLVVKQRETERLRILEKRNATKKAYIGMHTGTVVALDALMEVAGQSTDYTAVRAMFTALSPEVKNSRAGVNFSAMLEKIGSASVGNMAPGFIQNDTSGNPVALASFRGKYVLLDFWASWCVPCRAENPNVLKAFLRYKNKGFEVLGVSLDLPGKKQAWLDAIHKDGLLWTQVSDLQSWNNAVARLYAVQAIPKNFLLDPKGTIIAVDLSGEALDQKLAEIFP